jgi:hypothetical protein
MPAAEITLRTKARGVTLVLFLGCTDRTVCWELRRGADYRSRLGICCRAPSKWTVYVPDDEPDTLWIDGFCCQLATAAEAQRALDWVRAQQPEAMQDFVDAAP